ncbi:YiiX/YebB-like N1pC/P60 family cysteine hydrolase [Methylophaga sulfidovorans]|uniref:Permuted papain-like amidase enzyme, YaeF/YiiX, C92 family n=1 Tax=Methylophaga sulfidovorans TaxID=45496 RepID=A0A1I3VQA9_9GAMM|nr:YiiX/YebB-like N1pC/P60 family cysteine hydrolase [Methylophaga sulfidovorans]SFJ97319.1 Permuted papain-like amidase enzyme, YaeF/YiiX, C92 family [Methylophaga sulfidovorans]
MSTRNSNEQTYLKRLNDDVLKPGDILLTTTTATVSKAIRIATRSDISHAMVYVQNRSVIDATNEGVQARNTQRLFFEEECSIYALRLRSGISEANLNKVISYLRRQIGAEYTTKEAIQTLIGGTKQWSKKQFCSRLVAQAFSHANIQLVTNPNYCSPSELMNSSLLSPVPNACVKVAEEEIEFWSERDDVPQLMRDAINKLLDSARKKNSDIQTFEDLNNHLLSHPEQDNYFCQVLIDSGYLSIWKIELDKNQWQYYLRLMNELPMKEIEKYCLDVLQDQPGGTNRYIVSRAGYVVLSRQYELQYFRKMAELYEHLAGLHQQRVSVASRWLESKGLLTRPQPVHLVPHTDEWFSSMEQWDPPKAMMTRAIIEIYGNTNVCSVCGDAPAIDYYLDEENRPIAGPDTLRLCDDCVSIRRAAGEPFISLQ